MSPYTTTSWTTIIFFLHLLSTTRSTCPTLEEKLNGIDSLIGLAPEKIKALVGLSVGIVANGQIVFAKGYGLRNVSDSESHVTNRTIFAIGSCTKAFTSFAVDLLRKDGVLDWSDLVIRHIPEFRVQDEYATNNIRIKDLAAHLTGLPRHDMVWYGSNFSRHELLARLPHLQPNYSFRERFQYNNIMIAVEGMVVERASNRTWEDFVDRRILQPLRMTRTYTDVGKAWDARYEDIAAGYSVQGRSSVVNVPWLELSNMAPVGAIVSSAEDMTKWVQTQLSLSGRSTEMHDIQASMPANDANGAGALGYGLGWFVGYHNGRKVVYHGGETVGFVAWVTLFPAEKVGVVLLANTETRPVIDFLQNLGLKIGDILYGCNWTEAEHKEWLENEATVADDKQAALQWNISTSGAVPPPPVEQPDQYVGSFENSGYGIFKVFANGSGLAASFNGNYTVVPTTVRDFFYFNGVVGEYNRNYLGYVIGLYLDFEEAVAAPIFFAKKTPAHLQTLNYLQSFVGAYGNITITIMKGDASDEYSLLANGSVSVELNFANDELVPVEPNLFSRDRLFFEFIGTNNAVKELILHRGRSFKRISKG